MDQRLRVFLFCVAGFVLWTSGANAITKTLDASKDNTLYENASGGISNGAGEFFFVGRTGQLSNSIRRGLLQFDIAGTIPAGATIQSVQLTLHLSKVPLGSPAQTVALHAVQEDWGEGTSNDLGNEGSGTLATTGDATWVHTFFNTSTWSTVGGTFSGTVSSSASVNAVGFYTWGSTAQMVADVQGWLDNPGTDFGWLLLGNETTSKTARRFDTHENLVAGNRPKLVVEYTVPALPPSFEIIDPVVINEGDTLDLVVTATDPNETFPVLQAELVPANANFTDNNDGTGNLVFTPDFLQGGVYNVRLIASDGVFADTEIVAITVNEVTDPPTATGDTLATLEETPVSDVLAGTDPDGDTLFFEILDGPFHGALTAFDGASGSYTYEPALDFNGADSILFRSNDGNATSDTGLVLVNVGPVNDPPVAADLAVSVGTNTPKAVGAMPVTDVDDVAWTITQTAGPFHGGVSAFDPATGSFTYTPDLDYTGPDSILYVANDGDLESDTGVVRLDVGISCFCPFQSDMNADSTFNSTDLNLLIAALFFNGANPQDPDCPTTRADFNGDGSADSTDLNLLIKLLFFNGPGPSDPCIP